MRPYFRPWVGEGYRAAKPRILVLGESHYDKTGKDADREFTRRVAQGYVERRFTHRYWTLLARTIAGTHLSRRECGELWKTVAFYNYIQEPVGGRARLRPTQQMWDAAREPLLVVLRELMPNIVVVAGKALWLHLPAWEPLDLKLPDGDTWPAKKAPAGEGRTVMSYVNHPSSRGFKTEKWSAVVDALMDARGTSPRRSRR